MALGLAWSITTEKVAFCCRIQNFTPFKIAFALQGIVFNELLGFLQLKSSSGKWSELILAYQRSTAFIISFQATQLRKMSELSTETEMTFERPSSRYENLSSRFLQKGRNFRRQYAHLYAERLCSMYTRLTETANRKWGNDNKLL